MPARKTQNKKLQLTLTEEQLAAIRPLLEMTGKLGVAGHVEGNKLNISFLACNAAFLACNSPFIKASE